MISDFPTNARLYGILDLGYVQELEAAETTRRMIDGGIDILQLRWKNSNEDQVAALAEKIYPITKSADVPLVINDYPSLAGDGAHIGQDDGTLAKAREEAGTGKFIGRSTHSLAQAEAAMEEGADYIGFGPLFATPTKPGRPAIGLDDIAEVHHRVTLPIFCIGGIKLENLSEIVEAGARRVVIVSGILQAKDIAAYTRAAKALLPPLED
ncbi:MAG: thiamine phosphate synthase [Verrucomicrobiota bacterium]